MDSGHGGDWHIGRMIVTAIVVAVIGMLFDALGLKGFLWSVVKGSSQELAKEVISDNTTRRTSQSNSTAESELADQRQARKEAERRLRETQDAIAKERRQLDEAAQRQAALDAEQARQRQAAIEEQNRRQQATIERQQADADARRQTEAATWFTLVICNRTTSIISVALDYYSPMHAGQVVQGWFSVPPAQCPELGRYKKAGFKFFAKELNGPREWSGDGPICVEFPGPFLRLRSSNSSCPFNALKRFHVVNVSNDRHVITIQP